VIEILALIWAVSAAVCWEAQATVLHGEQRRWDAIVIGALMPVFNTIVAWGYVMDGLNRKGN
jgi:hypothetical protein